MARAALFVATSLAIHGAAVAVVLASRHGPVEARSAREADVAPPPLLVEGATVEAPETLHAPFERSSPSVASEPSRARGTPATRDEDTPLRPTGASNGGRTSPPASEAHAVSSARAESAGSAGNAAGAPRTVFGTAVLRSFLLALSADPRALDDAGTRTRLHYAGGDGGSARVLAEPEDAAGLRMAHALEALLAQASAGLPALAGELVVEASRDDLADGVFTITCDDTNRVGSVRFTDGRRIRVHERR